MNIEKTEEWENNYHIRFTEKEILYIVRSPLLT